MKNELIDTDDRIIDALLTRRGEVDKSVLMEFARWCALQAVRLWDAPAVVIAFLRTGDENLREAAHQAAVEHPIHDVVTAWAVEAARQATGDDMMSPEYRSYYAAVYAAMAIVHTPKQYIVEWSRLRDLQEEQLKSLIGERSKEMKINIDLDSAQQLAHNFFTNQVYRNQKVCLYVNHETGEIETCLPSEFLPPEWDYLCTLIDPYIEWGQSECADETELEDAFSAWLDREFDAWFDSLISAIES